MPLEVPPPLRSAACLSHVHWVRPELVAEVKFLTCTKDNLLRQVVYEGLREDKPVKKYRIRRSIQAAAQVPRTNHPLGGSNRLKTRTPPESGGVLSAVFGC